MVKAIIFILFTIQIQAKLSDCFSVDTFQSVINKLVKRDPIIPKLRHLDEPIPEGLEIDSFKVVGITEGIHGGRRYIVERQHAWSDWRKSGSFGDIISAMNKMPEILGERGAFYFGFQNHNEHFVSIPDFTEVSNAIKKFNENLSPTDPRRILVRPALLDADATSSLDIAKLFNNNYGTPMDTTGRMYFHDVTAHALQGFGLPNPISRGLQKMTMAWEEYMKIYAPKANPEELKRLKKVGSKITMKIDGAGNVLLPLIGRRFYQEEIYGSIKNMRKPLPDDAPETMIPTQQQWGINSFDHVRAISVVSIEDLALRTFGDEELSKHFLGFLQSKNIDIRKSWAPELQNAKAPDFDYIQSKEFEDRLKIYEQYDLLKPFKDRVDYIDEIWEHY